MTGLQGKSDTGAEFPAASITSAAVARRGPGASLARQITLEPSRAHRPVALTSPDSLADELHDLVHRPHGRRRARIPDDEPLALPLEQLQFDLAPHRTVARNEPIEVRAGMRLVAGALKVEHGGQRDPLATLQCLHRVALRHRLLGLPELIVAGQHAVHDLRVGWTSRLELLDVVVPRQRVDEGQHRTAHRTLASAAGRPAGSGIAA